MAAHGADEHTGEAAAAPPGACARRLREAAALACGRAAELAERAAAARAAAAVLRVEAQHARQKTRMAREGAAAAALGDGLDWSRRRRERAARRAALSRPARAPKRGGGP